MHKKRVIVRWARRCLAAYICVLSTAATQASEPAGVVIIAAGDVVAISQSNQFRPLRRKAPFFVGDVLRVPDTGQAQVRFRDGSILSLTGGTELRVDAFKFGASAQEDSNVVTLLKGGFRTITGAIAKRNPQAQQIVTPVATIGVRGTHYSVVMQDAMFVGVWSGVVQVNNEAGDLELGANRAFNYAQISDANEAPLGLLEPPDALMKIAAPTTTAEAKEESSSPKEESTAPEGEQAATDVTTNESGNDNTDSNSDAADADKNAETENTTTAAGDVDADESDQQVEDWGAREEQSEKLSGADQGMQTTTEGPKVDIAGQETTGTLPVDALSDFTVNITLGKIEERLAETRYLPEEAALLTYYGMAVAGGATSTFFAGRASNGQVAAPLIVDNGLLPIDPLYNTSVAGHVLRQGKATSSYYATYATLDASIGEWRGGSATPFIDETDVADASVHTPYATYLFWAITGPPALDTLHAMTGSVLYRNVVDVRAGATGANPTEIFTRTAIDFSTAQVNGKFYVHSDNRDDWDITFSGALRGAVLDLQVDTKTSSVKRSDGSVLGATGTLKAGLSGAGAHAIGGVFDFQTTGTTLLDIDGAFLLDDTAVGDLRLTSAEISALAYTGWAVIPLGRSSGFLLEGQATSGASGVPVFVNKVIDPDTGYAMDIARVGLAAPTNASSVNVGASVVHWGIWNVSPTTPAILETNADNPFQRTPIVGDVAWVTAIPTPASVLSSHAAAEKMGSWSGGAMRFFGKDHTGSTLSMLDFNANINFATGDVRGASLTSQAGSGTWSAAFSDSKLAGGMLRMNVNSATSMVTGLPVGPQSLTGRLAGGLVGDNAEGIAGVFHLHTEADTTVNLNGGLVTTGIISP